jgi:hypothetical protein
MWRAARAKTPESVTLQLWEVEEIMIDQEFMTVDEVKDKELVSRITIQELKSMFLSKSKNIHNIFLKIGQISCFPFSSLVGWSSRLRGWSSRLRVWSSRLQVWSNRLRVWFSRLQLCKTVSYLFQL